VKKACLLLNNMTQTRSASSAGGGSRGAKKTNKAAAPPDDVLDDDNDIILPPSHHHDDDEVKDVPTLKAASSSLSLLPRKRQASKSPAPQEMTEEMIQAQAAAITAAGGGVEDDDLCGRSSTPIINTMKSSDINQILHNSMEEDDDEGGGTTTTAAVAAAGGRRGSNNRASVSLNASFEAAAAASSSSLAAEMSPKKRTKSQDFEVDEGIMESINSARKLLSSQHLQQLIIQQHQQQKQQQVPDTPLRPPNNSKVSKRQKGYGGILFSPKPVYGKGIGGGHASGVERKKKSGFSSLKPNSGGGGKTLKRPPTRTITNNSTGGGVVVAALGIGGGGGSDGGEGSSDFQDSTTTTTSTTTTSFAHHTTPSSPPKNATIAANKKANARSPATPFRFHAFPDSLPRVHPRAAGLSSAKEGGLVFDNVGAGGGVAGGCSSDDAIANNNNPTPFRLDESFGTRSSNSSTDGKQDQQQQQQRQRQLRGGLSTQRMNLRPKPSPLGEDVPMRSPHSPATRRLFRSNPTTSTPAVAAAGGGGSSMIQLAPTQSFDVAESNAAISDALLVARNDSTDQNDLSGEWSEPTEMSMTNKLIRMSNVPTSINALHHHQEGEDEDDDDDETNTVMEEDIIENEEDETTTTTTKDTAGLAGTKLNFNSPRDTEEVPYQKSKTPDHHRIQFNLDVSPIYGDDDGMAEKGDDGSPMKGVVNNNDEEEEGNDVDELQHSYLPTSATSAAAYNADTSTFSAGEDASEATTTNANNTTRNSYASGFTRLNPRRTSRPMPDTSAFDVCTPSQSSLRSKDSGTQSKASELLCPPTPIRTPAWAHNAESALDKGHGQNLQRANSLIATKVLAECPPRVFDNLSSLEDSMLEHDVSGIMEAAPHLALTASFLPVEEKDEHDSFEGEEGSSSIGGAPQFRRLMSDASMGEMSSLKSDTMAAAKQQPRLSLEVQTDVGPVTFSDFDNVGILGSGAFADVFKVRSKKDQAFYAIKRTRRQFRGVKDRERAMTEVNTMKRLQSAVLSGASSSSSSSAAAASQQKSHGDGAGKTNYGLYLLFFIRAWQQDGFFYCQTELCSRATCRQLRLSLTTDWEKDVVKYPSLVLCLDSAIDVKKGKIQDRLIPERDIWQMCHDLSRGLFHIHSHGMVHYDIKPSNIFFVVNTKWGTICKIGDFGLAGDIGSSDDGQEGDTSYMANELLSSSLKHPGADIFSLGLTLYELAASATWALPREGDRWHDLRSGSHTPDLPTARNGSLVKLIQRMIHPDPTQRPSAEEITEHADVKRASASSDSFLSQYVGDVARHDSRREKEMESAEEEARKRSTTPVSSMLSPNATRLQRTKTPTFE
jgi:serine/threonine protein kinase